MIEWRTDLQNMPKNGTLVLVHNARNGQTEAVKWMIRRKDSYKMWCRPFSWYTEDDMLEIVPHFTHWAECNLPTENA